MNVKSIAAAVILGLVFSSAVFAGSNKDGNAKAYMDARFGDHKTPATDSASASYDKTDHPDVVVGHVASDLKPFQYMGNH